MSVTSLRPETEPPRLPPANTEAEQALLGALLLNNAAHARVVDFLLPEHFFNAVHGRIYAAIGELIGRGVKADPITLKSMFDRDGSLAAIGGAQYLARLAECAVTIINAPFYAETIVDMAARRDLIITCQDAIEAAYRCDLDEPAHVLSAECSDRLRTIGASVSADIDAAGDTAAAWLDRDIPDPDVLLGPFSTTTRGLISADSGLGKTNFCMAMAFSMSAGRGFLHWTARRPARVLYIEGEMSRRLLRHRVRDAVRRLGTLPAGLHLLSADEREIPPLNTPAGQRFVDRYIDRIGGVDFIFFDNVQALLPGDMKDEEPWQQILPWVGSLTRRSIGQLWIHHTGHDTSRAYGTKTRDWRMDMAMIGEAVERPASDIAFSLKFTKARERDRDNREDFATVVVTLQDDEWSVEHDAKRPAPAKAPSPAARKFHDALLDAIVSAGINGTPQTPRGRPAVTHEQWLAECVRLGLADPGDDKPTKSRNRALISKYRRELIAANWIACDGDFRWSICQQG